MEVRERLCNATAVRVSVAAGVVELIGSRVVRHGCPQELQKGSGALALVAYQPRAFTIAMVAGVLLIASGLLMLGSRVRPEAADTAQAAPDALVG